MLISDIKPDNKITITVGIGMQVLEFTTSAKEIFESCIYCEPILQNNKMVGFSSAGLVLSVIVPDEEAGKAYKFSNVKIRNIKTPDGSLFHEITCRTEGKIINRRGACRVWLGEQGYCTVGLGNEPIDITVKDISISGIGFLCSKDHDIPDGSIVHITFTDESSKSRFSLGAIVVRNNEMEKNRMLYGCKLNQESNAVAKFVNDKQREKLKASRQSKAVALTEGKK